MSGPSALQIFHYAAYYLGLKFYFRHPGDGRLRPRIPAEALVWPLLMARRLRAASFLRIEWLVRSPARRGLGVGAAFGDGALAYCAERLDPEQTRTALRSASRQAQRNTPTNPAAASPSMWSPMAPSPPPRFSTWPADSVSGWWHG